MDDNVQVLKAAQKLYDAKCLEDAYSLVQVLVSRKHIDTTEAALFLGGKICEASGDFRLAIDYYSQTTKFIHQCSLDDIHYRIAHCYIKLKLYKDAEDAVI